MPTKYLLISALIGVIGLYFFKKQLQSSNSPIALKLRNLWNGLYDGLTSVLNLKRRGAFLFHTFFIWAMYYAASYILFFALPQFKHLSPLAGLTVLVFGSIGMTAPTQGGIGAYHFLVASILALYGFTQQDGVVLATFIHGCQNLLFVPVFGATAFLIALFLNNQQKKQNLPNPNPPQ